MAKPPAKPQERIPVNPQWAGGSFLDFCVRQEPALCTRQSTPAENMTFSLTDRGQAKPYQIRQFLREVEQFQLTLKD